MIYSSGLETDHGKVMRATTPFNDGDKDSCFARVRLETKHSYCSDI